MNFIRKIFYLAFDVFYFLKFKILLTNAKNKVVIFDIDNTIANTWPSYLSTYNNHYERLENLEPFVRMINLVKSYVHDGVYVLFITAREYRFCSVTADWLKKQSLPYKNLILVRSPNQKLKLLKQISNIQVTFYDDLSYNHENGEIKFYEKEIEEISKLNYIKHIGYNEILNWQSKGE